MIKIRSTIAIILMFIAFKIMDNNTKKMITDTFAEGFMSEYRKHFR